MLGANLNPTPNPTLNPNPNPNPTNIYAGVHDPALVATHVDISDHVPMVHGALQR